MPTVNFGESVAGRRFNSTTENQNNELFPMKCIVELTARGHAPRASAFNCVIRPASNKLARRTADSLGFPKAAWFFVNFLEPSSMRMCFINYFVGFLVLAIFVNGILPFDDGDGLLWSASSEFTDLMDTVKSSSFHDFDWEALDAQPEEDINDVPVFPAYIAADGDSGEGRHQKCSKCVRKGIKLVMKHAMENFKKHCSNTTCPFINRLCNVSTQNPDFLFGYLMHNVRPLEMAIPYCLGAGRCHLKQRPMIDANLGLGSALNSMLETDSPAGLTTQQSETSDLKCIARRTAEYFKDLLRTVEKKCASPTSPIMKKLCEFYSHHTNVAKGVIFSAVQPYKYAVGYCDAKKEHVD
ncbi:hypothetical protein FOL47_001262 [Perkinsus chesapeaki]|uniref:Uncharacterized protein n=1 Tax=Perkinsus chesapeaki TaxID=330153 RepID=A0A7J6KTA8_PERCH|nr:hypothetical protein FOL47_001262 [Perkinsus chesapeaki]